MITSDDLHARRQLFGHIPHQLVETLNGGPVVIGRGNAALSLDVRGVVGLSRLIQHQHVWHRAGLAREVPVQREMRNQMEPYPVLCATDARKRRWTARRVRYNGKPLKIESNVGPMF